MTAQKRFNGAIFSGDYRYRFLLWRIWGEGPHLLWIMLNPSSANAIQDDPTLESCTRISKYRKYGGLEVVNLFAYRTAKPHQLRSACDPVGIDNDRYVAQVANRAAKIVVAWGEHGAFQGRGQAVYDLLSPPAQPRPLFCLGKVQSGCPRHPLYMPASTELVPYP